MVSDYFPYRVGHFHVQVQYVHIYVCTCTISREWSKCPFLQQPGRFDLPRSDWWDDERGLMTAWIHNLDYPNNLLWFVAQVYG